MTQLNNALILSAILTLSAALPVMAANSEKDYRDNVQWAKDSIKQNQNKAGYTGFDVNSLCKDATCQQEVANPSESRYYNNPSAMDSAKMQGMSTDGQAQAVTSGFNNGRPTIDENDPAYHTAVGYQNDAYNISHGISSKYHDCEKGLVCEVDSQPRSCTLPTNNPVQCYLTPFVKSTSTQHKEHTFRLSGLPPFSVELPNPDAIITDLRFNGGFLSWGNPISVEISLNEVVIGTVPIKKEEGHCGQDGACPSSVNASLNASHYQGGAAPMSVNVGTIFGSWGWPFYLSVTNFPITFITTENNVEIGYNNSCGAVLPECQQVQSQCIEGKETRMINGISVTLDCWKEQTTYQCAFPNTCDAIADCSIQSTSCDTQLGGVCIKDKQQRLCDKQQCRDTGLICGADSFALSGDYYDPAATRSTDFNHAAAGLAAVSDAAGDVKDKANINENSAIIFKGNIMECSDKALGISNCCQDSGWGNGIGLTSCSEEEKALGTAKEDKLTVSLGQYCAEKVLGVCIRKKKAYCAFDSKLARIVQVEGRAQLGKNFGSAKHPDCSAFSPNELQRIDMSSMDFSDFYEDMYDAIELPSTDEIQKRLQQSVGGTKP
ncbi:type-F conjugative transfer system mating-pair stabilization protein TraN (plasmid) [Shewanella baltica OS195]|uniref:Type-F conjugative transfer system mating-pair stabilization protein TraN n=1 Tax=Shewanella baltica (strain OS195) TaxID=399599 RepID=A9L6J6_SHEB9|nr:type-F conjugative transfer system mating-pair stabilization protein TraN [Shewanella baltica]ABX51778.1 type-F conjugative transfer system mating-pair stabilization protein TraN [Shewanella baltica OS195]ADT96689.1 type-F conjugative transfer system mating-pair stabilization protein TraN [Shewanella baltica OS678]